MFQIVFNEISAAEMSRIDTLDQLEIFDQFQINSDDMEKLDEQHFGKLEREGKTLHRFRSSDYRIYFEVAEDKVIVHRVLHKGSFTDFMFRANLSTAEDEQLADSKHFWNLIDEGRNARRVD